MNGKEVPKGGCLGVSEARLAKGGPDLDAHGAQGRDALNAVLLLRSQAESVVVRHPAYRSMVQNWSQCMKKAGHSFDTFAAARNNPAWQGERPGKGETAVATADASCLVKADYKGVVRKLRDQYDREVAAQHLDLLQAVREHYRTVVGNARTAAS
ncbi:hypothetical protein ACFYVL_38710 [Streptomyces sp. NPDC004111]|uniref:hypothetical protein n=1 Tax=Streptomyces sp. NPDC004111 TaxID=3364690 RepID=UPI0036CA6C49